MEAIKEPKPGYRPKIQHSEQDIYEKALKICKKYAEAKNQLETICIHYKISDRTFRRWVNQYPTVRQYYNDAITQIKEAKAEKMGILAITGQEKLLKGAEYTTTEINESFDNDGNRTGYTKRTLIRQLPPNVQMVKFTLSNYDKKHCQLKPWGDDKHDNNSWMNKDREPSLLFREAEALKEIKEYQEFLKWKETNNLDNVRHVRTSLIIDKESPDIMGTHPNDDNEPQAQSQSASAKPIEYELTNNDKITNQQKHPQMNADTWKQTIYPEGPEANMDQDAINAREAAAQREIEDYKEYLKLKETWNTSDDFFVPLSEITDNESHEISDDCRDETESKQAKTIHNTQSIREATAYSMENPVKTPETGNHSSQQSESET